MSDNKGFGSKLDDPFYKREPRSEGVYGTTQMVESIIPTGTRRLMKQGAYALRSVKDMSPAFRRGTMRGLRAMPEMVANNVREVVMSEAKPTVVAQMGRKRILHLNKNFNNEKMLKEINPLYSAWKEDEVERFVEKIMLHEGTHTFNHNMLPKSDNVLDIEFNRSAQYMSNSTKRFHAIQKPTYDQYKNSLHEVHARAIETRDNIYRDLLKRGSKMPTEEIDRIYKEEFVKEARKAMKQLKQTNPTEAETIERMAHAEMHRMYGDGWRQRLKAMEKQK